MMSTYVAAISIFVLVLTPVLIPAAVELVHAIGSAASRLTAFARTRAVRPQRAALQPAV
jgi:hypothetical protein